MGGEASVVKQSFKDSGFETLDRDQFMRLLTKLNPAFSAEEVAQIADGAQAGAFTGGKQMCCSALVDYLFGLGASAHTDPLPSTIVMGDLGSGKTSAYLFRRTDQGGIQVKELMDGDSAELPSLASCPFEEWAAAFSRAAGEYLNEYPVHIGATEWYRQMPEVQQVDLGLRLWGWGESFPCGFRLLEVTGQSEATFEATACQHACNAVLGLVPEIILSSGTGSMQCTAGGVSESISLDTKMWAKRPREEVPAFRAAAVDAMRPFAPLLQSGSCKLALLLGASWYAVVSAGMADSKAEPFQIPRGQAIMQLEAFALKPDTAMRDAVNVWRIVDVLNMMRLDDVVFGRNWKVHGENFRTTWSVGYFVDGCQ